MRVMTSEITGHFTVCSPIIFIGNLEVWNSSYEYGIICISIIFQLKNPTVYIFQAIFQVTFTPWKPKHKPNVSNAK